MIGREIYHRFDALKLLTDRADDLILSKLGINLVQLVSKVSHQGRLAQ
jgi:hypothetical protein